MTHQRHRLFERCWKASGIAPSNTLKPVYRKHPMFLRLAYAFYLKTSGLGTDLEAAGQGGLRFSLFQKKNARRVVSPTAQVACGPHHLTAKGVDRE
jgi:hypothetical protein